MTDDDLVAWFQAENGSGLRMIVEFIMFGRWDM